MRGNCSLLSRWIEFRSNDLWQCGGYRARSVRALLNPDNDTYELNRLDYFVIYLRLLHWRKCNELPKIYVLVLLGRVCLHDLDLDLDDTGGSGIAPGQTILFQSSLFFHSFLFLSLIFITHLPVIYVSEGPLDCSPHLSSLYLATTSSHGEDKGKVCLLSPRERQLIWQDEPRIL